jgi:uncharacterized membrane protein (GlpM family)
MSPDPFFWYALVLKVAMTATIVVVVSVAAERSGPFIAALIAALPTAASATYIILAVEHPPAFVAAAAIGSMAANAAVAIFALTYAALAQRQGIVLSIAVATLLWFGVAAVLRLVEWTPVTALVLNAVVFAFTIPLSARYRDAAMPRDAIRRSRYDLPLRAAAAALVVAAVTTASHWIGSFASGVFAVFPIVLATFVVIMHPRAGGKAAAAVLAHAQPVLVGLPLDFSECIILPGGSACGGRSRLALRSRWRGAPRFGSCDEHGCASPEVARTATSRSRASARGSPWPICAFVP